MIPDAFREAHDAVDSSLSDIAALANALYQISTETGCIQASAPDAKSINVLIRTIEAECKKALNQQTAAWEAIRETLHASRIA